MQRNTLEEAECVKSVGSLLEFVGVLVPFVLDDDLFVAELFLGLSIDKLKDLIKLLAHAGISGA